MVEKIIFKDKIIAILVRREFNEDGIRFFTPDDYSQQLAFIKHLKGKVIQPHVHNPILREVSLTNEVLFIRKGKLRVDFFDDLQNYIESRVLFPGDVILLSTGGHGFTVLEDLEMFEVKQGPYAGDMDKTRFNPGDDLQIIIK